MIPVTLSSMEAQRLLDLGRAWLADPEHLITRRARYTWDAARQQYLRTEIPAPEPAPAPPCAGGAAGAPRPVPGLGRLATCWARLRPQPPAPIAQPRLGLARLATVVAWVGVGLLLLGGALALLQAAPVIQIYGAMACEPTNTYCRALRDDLIIGAFLGALPSVFWVGLWVTVGGGALWQCTSARGLVGNWLWSAGRREP